MASRSLAQMMLQEKPCLVLLAVAQKRRLIISDVMRQADTTFAHATHLVAELETRGLVTTSAEGRVKYVQPTSLGLKVARALRTVAAAGDPQAASAEVRRLSRLAHRLAADWDDTEARGEGVARLGGRLRRLCRALDTLEFQSMAADVNGEMAGMGELRGEVEALRARALPPEKGGAGRRRAR